MIALLAALFVQQASSIDEGVLIGLRDPEGGLRTVLVATRGVAYVSDVKQGLLLRPAKLGVNRFRTTKEGLEYEGSLSPLEGKFRVSWVAQPYIGIEFDAAQPGEAPYSHLYRRAYAADGSTVPLTQDLNESDKARYGQAAAEGLKNASAARLLSLPGSPSVDDWGYVRDSGKWLFVNAFASPTDRLEFAVPAKPPTMNPPSDRGEIDWRTVTQAHPDATDVVADRDAPFAVVVTPDFLFVHTASRKSLGRVVRKIACHEERLVSAFWGGAIDSWQKAFRG